MVYDYDVKFNHKLYKAGENVPISPVIEEEIQETVIESAEKTVDKIAKKGRSKKVQ